MSVDPILPSSFFRTVHPQANAPALMPAIGTVHPQANPPNTVNVSRGLDILTLTDSTPTTILGRRGDMYRQASFDVGWPGNALPVLRFTPPGGSSPIAVELTDGNEPLAQITRDGKILVSRKLTVLFDQVLRHGELPVGFGEAPTPVREPAPRELDLNQDSG